MKNILYGASVQGIQRFIFKTNKLREIAGASQIVDELFDTEFDRFLNKLSLTISKDDVLMKAAGSIKLKLDADSAKKIFEKFPQYVATKYPGLELSQAIVELKKDKLPNKDFDLLESKLRIKRNMPEMPVESGFMALERARKTGGVAKHYDKKDSTYIDKASQAKQDVLDSNKISLTDIFDKSQKNRFPKDFGDLTKGKENAWMAVVHADGNSLGNKIQNLFNEHTEDASKALKEFSEKLEKATKNAALKAFQLVSDKYSTEKKNKSDTKWYRFRPIILGGDDLTVVIRADLAWDFTNKFLHEFEAETEKAFGHFKGINSKLTACAGIAYIKEKYPFHYGVHLAEDLAKQAKKASKAISKDTPPSSVQFYKVQSSFTEDLKTMQERTHNVVSSGIDFCAGPYFIHKDMKNAYHAVKELDDIVKELGSNENDKDKPVSKLRSIISELYKDKSTAEFMLNRMKSVNSDFYKDIDLDTQLNLKKENTKKKSLILDALHLHGFKS